MMVYVVEYSHRHGQDFKAFDTHSRALEFCASLCDQYAGECSDDPALVERIRALCAAGQWTECVAVYVEAHDSESLDIHELEVQS